MNAFAHRLSPHTRPVVLAALVMIAAWFAPAAAFADTRKLEVIERVAAVVNDEAILLSDLRRRAIPLLPQVMTAATAVEREARLNQLYAQLLDVMIDDALLQQAAHKMKIRATRDEVDQTIANYQRQSGLAEDAFWDNVKSQGLTESEFRSDVRRQVLSYKVLAQRAGNRIQVTDQEIRQRYEEQLARESRVLRFRISHLFLPLAATASAKDAADVLAKMNALRATVTAENFEATMQSNPGGDLGWLRDQDLPPALKDTVLTMDAGEVSAPVRGPNGYHILFLHERGKGESAVPSYEEAKAKIQSEIFQQAAAKQQRLILDELRRDAVVEKRL